MQHWYVYYKLPPAQYAAVTGRVRSMQDRLALEGGVRTRLLERTEQAETTTVMEVYEDIVEPGRFAQLLDAAVHDAGLPAEVVAARRVERFRDL